MRLRRLRLLGVSAGAVALLAVAGCAGGDAAGTGAGGNDSRYVAGTGDSEMIDPADRSSAPGVEGTTLDGKRLRLADYQGKVVVLNFWASWCAPCRAETPVLERVSADTESDGVRFVGINIKDGRQPARAFVRNNEVDYPSLYDQPGELGLAFRDTVPPQAIPSTIVIDREGRIAGKIIGAAKYTPLNDLVTKVAAEK